MGVGVGSVYFYFYYRYYKRARSKTENVISALILSGLKVDNQVLSCGGILWGVGLIKSIESAKILKMRGVRSLFCDCKWYVGVGGVCTTITILKVRVCDC